MSKMLFYLLNSTFYSISINSNSILSLKLNSSPLPILSSFWKVLPVIFILILPQKTPSALCSLSITSRYYYMLSWTVTGKGNVDFSFSACRDVSWVVLSPLWAPMRCRWLKLELVSWCKADTFHQFNQSYT